MLMSELITAVLPRIGRAPKTSAITIFQAASAIQSLIYKYLLDRKSDLLIGDLNLSIAAYGYYQTLPSDFLSMAERPHFEELVTDWMAGTVTSYDSETGALVVNIGAYSGTTELSLWYLATGATPGSPALNVGTSTTSLTPGTGTKSLVVDTDLSLSAGQYVILSASNAPEGWISHKNPLEPNYLNDDADDHNQSWWDWYANSLNEIDCSKPEVYKVIGSTLYVRPTPSVDIIVKGKYNAKPTELTTASQTIPWEGKFDQIFIEGCVRIILSGTVILDANQEFMTFFNREFSTVIDSRARLLPRDGRMKRSNYM